MDKPLVHNAGDEEQVRRAGQRSKNIRQQELEDIRFVLQSKQGRRLYWRLMGYCKIHGSIWEPSAKIHYNAGQQDVGHFLMAEVLDAGEEILFLMMKESQNKES